MGSKLDLYVGQPKSESLSTGVSTPSTPSAPATPSVAKPTTTTTPTVSTGFRSGGGGGGSFGGTGVTGTWEAPATTPTPTVSTPATTTAPEPTAKEIFATFRALPQEKQTWSALQAQAIIAKTPGLTSGTAKASDIQKAWKDSGSTSFDTLRLLAEAAAGKEQGTFLTDTYVPEPIVEQRPPPEEQEPRYPSYLSYPGSTDQYTYVYGGGLDSTGALGLSLPYKTGYAPSSGLAGAGGVGGTSDYTQDRGVATNTMEEIVPLWALNTNELLNIGGTTKVKDVSGLIGVTGTKVPFKESPAPVEKPMPVISQYPGVEKYIGPGINIGQMIATSTQLTQENALLQKISDFNKKIQTTPKTLVYSELGEGGGVAYIPDTQALILKNERNQLIKESRDVHPDINPDNLLSLVATVPEKDKLSARQTKVGVPGLYASPIIPSSINELKNIIKEKSTDMNVLDKSELPAEIKNMQPAIFVNTPLINYYSKNQMDIIEKNANPRMEKINKIDADIAKVYEPLVPTITYLAQASEKLNTKKQILDTSFAELETKRTAYEEISQNSPDKMKKYNEYMQSKNTYDLEYSGYNAEKIAYDAQAGPVSAQLSPLWQTYVENEKERNDVMNIYQKALNNLDILGEKDKIELARRYYEEKASKAPLAKRIGIDLLSGIAAGGLGMTRDIASLGYDPTKLFLEDVKNKGLLPTLGKPYAPMQYMARSVYDWEQPLKTGNVLKDVNWRPVRGGIDVATMLLGGGYKRAVEAGKPTYMGIKITPPVPAETGLFSSATRISTAGKLGAYGLIGGTIVVPPAYRVVKAGITSAKTGQPTTYSIDRMLQDIGGGTAQLGLILTGTQLAYKPPISPSSYGVYNKATGELEETFKGVKVATPWGLKPIGKFKKEFITTETGERLYYTPTAKGEIPEKMLTSGAVSESPWRFGVGAQRTPISTLQKQGGIVQAAEDTAQTSILQKGLGKEEDWISPDDFLTFKNSADIAHYQRYDLKIPKKAQQGDFPIKGTQHMDEEQFMANVQFDKKYGGLMGGSTIKQQYIMETSPEYWSKYRPNPVGEISNKPLTVTIGEKTYVGAAGPKGSLLKAADIDTKYPYSDTDMAIVVQRKLALNRQMNPSAGYRISDPEHPFLIVDKNGNKIFDMHGAAPTAEELEAVGNPQIEYLGTPFYKKFGLFQQYPKRAGVQVVSTPELMNRDVGAAMNIETKGGVAYLVPAKEAEKRITDMFMQQQYAAKLTGDTAYAAKLNQFYGDLPTRYKNLLGLQSEGAWSASFQPTGSGLGISKILGTGMSGSTLLVGGPITETPAPYSSFNVGLTRPSSWQSSKSPIVESPSFTDLGKVGKLGGSVYGAAEESGVSSNIASIIGSVSPPIVSPSIPSKSISSKSISKPSSVSTSKSISQPPSPPSPPSISEYYSISYPPPSISTSVSTSESISTSNFNPFTGRPVGGFYFPSGGLGGQPAQAGGGESPKQGWVITNPLRAIEEEFFAKQAGENFGAGLLGFGGFKGLEPLSLMKRKKKYPWQMSSFSSGMAGIGERAGAMLVSGAMTRPNVMMSAKSPQKAMAESSVYRMFGKVQKLTPGKSKLITR